MGLASYIRDHGRVFLFCFIGGLLMPLVTCSSCYSSVKLYLLVTVYTFTIWISMWLGNEGVSHWLDVLVPWTKRPGLRLLLGIAGMLIYTVPVILVIIWFFQTVFDLYLGDLRIMVYSTVLVTFVITLVMTSRSFFLEWRQAAINAERLEREGVQAKYEALQNQVNPHFLFNSLNALANLVYDDQEKAVRFIKQLSDVYRYVLDTRDKEIVPLTEEAKFVDAYIFLQRIRFGEKLLVENRINEGNGMVAPLAVQMLVENAIKHNVVSGDSPLTIRLFIERELIVVENTVNKKQQSGEPGSGLGLENIRKRYSLLSDVPVGVQSSDSVFRVSLPIIKY